MPRRICPRLLAVMAMAALTALLADAVSAQIGDGWAISPSEIRVDGIRPGETVTVEVTVANNKDTPVSFLMSAVVPGRDRLRPGYEPLPDAAWVTFPAEQIQLGPRSQQRVSATLSVPADGDWGGRTYEGWLTAAPVTAGVLQVEISCRLLVSTSSAYAPDNRWLVVAGIVGAVVVIAGMAYGGRRELSRWLAELRERGSAWR